MWNQQKRIEPGPGQESVWDYPRPPRLEDTSHHIEIEFAGELIAVTGRAKRVLETSHPPVYYIPPEDIRMNLLSAVPGSSFCEWKGEATYFDLEVGAKRVVKAAWCYRNPTGEFKGIKNFLAFYPSKMDRCSVDDEIVAAQAGDFYGGWITSSVVGPFKGEPGTSYW